MLGYPHSPAESIARRRPGGPAGSLGPPPVQVRVIRGFQGIDVGDRARVKLVDTNVERGSINIARDRGRTPRAYRLT